MSGKIQRYVELFNTNNLTGQMIEEKIIEGLFFYTLKIQEHKKIY